MSRLKLKKECEIKFDPKWYSARLKEELEEEARTDVFPVDLKTIRGPRRIFDPDNRHTEPMNIRELPDF